MLRRLRIKLVALVMGVVALILAVVFSAICLLDYQQDIADVESALQESLAHADGSAREHYGFESAEPRPMPPPRSEAATTRDPSSPWPSTPCCPTNARPSPPA